MNLFGRVTRYYTLNGDFSEWPDVTYVDCPYETEEVSVHIHTYIHIVLVHGGRGREGEGKQV